MAKSADGVTYWERVAKTTWGGYVASVEQAAILRAHRLARHVTTALDIGCEGGRWSQLLGGLGWRMTCTDIDPESLRVCQRRIPDATCVLVNPGDARLPCEDESEGLIVCIQVPSVIGSDWFIGEAGRVLQRRGLLVAEMNNQASWRGLVWRIVGGMKSSPDSYRLSYRELRRRLCARGFSVAYEEGYCWLPFRRESNSRLVPMATRFERVLHWSRLAFLSPRVVFIARKTG